MIFICLKIFFARIIDVTLGSIRTILMVKGKSIISAIIAFLEVLIWFVVAKEALVTTIDSVLIPIFYSAGYATGTLLGTYLSNNLINGVIGLQVITDKNNRKLIDKIRDEGFGISIINLKNYYKQQEKEMLFIQLSKKRLKALIKIIKDIDSNAFIVMNETKYIQNGFIK